MDLVLLVCYSISDLISRLIVSAIEITIQIINTCLAFQMVVWIIDYLGIGQLLTILFGSLALLKYLGRSQMNGLLIH